ncbi:MAG: glycoside hydrolase family 3 protein [Candidatus Nealsonbacteria bacterium]
MELIRKTALIMSVLFMGTTVFSLSGPQQTEKTVSASQIRERIVQKEIEETISDQNLKEKIGQMLMIGFRGTEVSEDSEIIKIIKELNLGAVILFDYDIPSGSFPRNIVNAEQTKKLVNDMKELSASALLVAVDAEGGNVNRLKEKYGFTKLPSPEEIGYNYNTEEVENIYSNLALELSDLGISFNLAPGVDVNTNVNNPVIGSLGRSFSVNPQMVTYYATIFIEAHLKNNLLTTLKHFPGHGSSNTDSHEGLVDLTDTYQKEELIPFERLIEKGLVDVIMMAHVIDQNIDPEYPASLSSKFINGLLRGEMNYQGVVISDDMQMGAINKNFGFEESIIKAVNAGCDMLLFSNNTYTYDEGLAKRAQEVIFEAVKNGEIEVSRVVEASDRIYKLKEKLEN